MNLDTTIDLDIKGFLQWWGRELAFLVPAKLRQSLRERNGTLVFIPDEQGFIVTFQTEEGLQAILKKRIEITDGAAYQHLKSQHPGFEKADVVLELTPSQALQKIIYLPMAAQENLQQVVSFELDRYTPFKPEQVYFSVVTLGKTESGQVQVLLVLTPKASLDSQLASLENWGVRPHRVLYSQAVNDIQLADKSYNLLPERYRQSGSKLGQSLHWLLNLAILLLTLAVLILPVWQESQAVEQLKNKIKALEKQTQIVEAQQLEIDALHAETQKLIDVKQQTPELLKVLNELSSLLNDETWLTHLQYADKQMQIQGQSPAASALISVLEASEFFNNVSFVSPLTQDKVTGRERFQISMNIAMPIAKPDVTEPVDPESTTQVDEQKAVIGSTVESGNE